MLGRRRRRRASIKPTLAHAPRFLVRRGSPDCMACHRGFIDCMLGLPSVAVYYISKNIPDVSEHIHWDNAGLITVGHHLWYCQGLIKNLGKGGSAYGIFHLYIITFVQCWTNVEDVAPTFYKCYTDVLCLLRYKNFIGACSKIGSVFN